MRCTKPIRLSHLNHIEYPDGLLVPCGKCLSCRIARRQEWSMRCLHELSQFDKAVFVTLTYDNEHLPPFGSLVLADLQKFYKRLRKEVTKVYGSSYKIRHYSCGEYGDNFGRPHYHAIIFGLGLIPSDKDMIRWKWSHGSVFFGTVTPDSISYVCQYIDKKVYWR